MKKINVLLFCFLAVTIFSCSKDDNKDNTQLEENIDPQGINDLEEVLLDINAVSSGININGATSVMGSPTPSGDIALSIDYEKQTAFQKNGFNIEFKAPTGFAGAYIQVKDENGMANSYFDVPASAINESNFGDKGRAKRDLGIFKNMDFKKTSKVDEDVRINVDFSDEVPAGTFCYVLCVYDEEGNISAPSEVCVTVESWGGNANLEASWDFSKIVSEDKTTNVGEENCEDGYNYNLQCDNGETKEVAVSYCSTINSFELTFMSDGTYSFSVDNDDKDFDFLASEENCDAIYQNYQYTYISEGNWAFNEEEGELTLVEFKYTDIEEGETYVEEIPEGDLILNGAITLTANELILNVSDDEDYNEDFYFDKK